MNEVEDPDLHRLSQYRRWENQESWTSQKGKTDLHRARLGSERADDGKQGKILAGCVCSSMRFGRHEGLVQPLSRHALALVCVIRSSSRGRRMFAGKHLAAERHRCFLVYGPHPRRWEHSTVKRPELRKGNADPRHSMTNLTMSLHSI